MTKATATEKHPNWGGFRPGSGRPIKIEGRKQIGLQLTEDQVSWLDERALAADTNRSDLVRNLIARAMTRAAIRRKK